MTDVARLGTIVVTAGTGMGRTELAAFDAALFDAGVGDFNIVRLSSIIPCGVAIETKKYAARETQTGDKLYVVLSMCLQTCRGRSAYAGLGWCYSKKRGGIFVEQHGQSYDEVKTEIHLSIEDMRQYRSMMNRTHYTIVGAECISVPVCAVVVAVYKAETW